MDRARRAGPPAQSDRAGEADARSVGPLARGGADIGKIVRSESHVRYTCQIYAPGETATPPAPEDYAFGSFVRIPLRSGPAAPDALFPPSGDALPSHAPAPGESWAVGLIYDTILMNPAFGAMGPRLSNDAQVELFSPDYVTERAVLVSVLLLGAVERGADGRERVSHGIPALAPDLGAVVSPLGDEAVRAFHYFADAGVDAAGIAGGPGRPYLHMGYLPHAVQLDNALLPMAILRVIERLEALFPERRALLSIVRRNFAWRLKVQSAG
jgi:hypothetical protein